MKLVSHILHHMLTDPEHEIILAISGDTFHQVNDDKGQANQKDDVGSLRDQNIIDDMLNEVCGIRIQTAHNDRAGDGDAEPKTVGTQVSQESEINPGAAHPSFSAKIDSCGAPA